MTNASGEGRPRRKRWSAEEVLTTIQGLSDRSAKAVQRSTPALYGAAVRIFGSWRAAIGAAGQDYGGIRKRRPPGFWTGDRISQDILNLTDRSSSVIRKDRADLYSAALRIYGSWQKAVEAAGFNYSQILRGWVAADALRLRFRKASKS